MRKSQGIHVYVVERHRAGRKVFVLRPVDRSGKRKFPEQTSQANRRSDAIRESVTLARELEAARSAGEQVSWDLFLTRLSGEKLVGNRLKTQAATLTALRRLASFERPQFLADVDGEFLSRFIGELYRDELSVASIASYLRSIRAALRWGARVWPGYTAPAITLPKLPKGKRMKGRPITGEEFERMLAAVPRARILSTSRRRPGASTSVIGHENAESWRWLLRGIYLCGRRLGEVIKLTWDDPQRPHLIDLDGKTPMFCIPAEYEKGGEELIEPLMPDFAAMLRKVPSSDRRGRIFRPELQHGPVRSGITVSAIISEIGRVAGVVVDRKKKRDGSFKEKYASAHDLRRAFGTRWAPKLKPVILQRIMGHKDFRTTMQYYVDLDNRAITADLWREFCGKVCGSKPKAPGDGSLQIVKEQGLTKAGEQGFEP